MSLTDWRHLPKAAGPQDGLDRPALDLYRSLALAGARGAPAPRGWAPPAPDTSNDAAIAAAMAGAPPSEGAARPGGRGGAPSATDGDEDYARALAAEAGLSQREIEERALSSAGLSPREIEDRARSEAQSRQALCNISCATLPGGPTSRGTLLVDGAEYVFREAGSTAGGDSNMCFYLSVAAALGGCEPAGLERRACELKRALAPRADQIARDTGMDEGGYTLPGSSADTPVVFACVEHARRPLCIYSPALRGSAHEILLYRTPGCAGAPLVLHYTGSHYQPCLPA